MKTIKIAIVAMMGMCSGVKAQDNKIRNTGNVGIGILSPAHKLHVKNDTGDSFTLIDASVNSGIRFLNGVNSFIEKSSGSGSLTIKNQVPQGRLQFGTENITRMTILPNGKVGIGTNNPSRSLHVKSDLWHNSYGSGVIFENNNSIGSGITLKPTASKVSKGTLGWSIYAGGPNSVIKDGNLGFWAHGTNSALMSINRSGKVGIGTYTPSERLDVNGNLKITGDLKMSGSDSYIRTNGTGTGYTGIWDQKNSRVLLYTSERDGNVGIGTTNTKGFKLGVNGKVAATEVKVTTYSNWADFVFENDYNLPTLKEVENHIIENGHLRDIPSAKEVEKNGFFLGEMNAKLLQKIEELTLYTIEQEKKLKSQEIKINALEKSNSKIEKQEKEIEQLKKQNSEIKKQQKKIERFESLVQKLLKGKN